MQTTGSTRANVDGTGGPLLRGSWWSPLRCSLGLHRWEVIDEPAQRKAEHFRPYRKMRCWRCRRVSARLYQG